MLLVVSCATTYGPSGLTGGYSDKRINDSAYFVTFGGNGYASQTHVWNMWFYRCAELTLQNGFRYFTVKPGREPQAALSRDGILHAAYSRDGGRLMPAVYTPGRNGQRKGQLYKTYTTYITTWSSSGTVLMYKDPLPKEVTWAFDAKLVTADLEPFVRSNGSKPAPGREQVLGHAFTAHARIEFGEGNIAAQAAPEVGKGGKALSLRTNAGLAGTLHATRPVLATVFREYQERQGTSGTVVVGFTVTPNGTVSDSHLVNASISDQAFVKLVVEAVRRADFGAADVATTTVVELPITFTVLDGSPAVAPVQGPAKTNPAASPPGTSL